MKNKIKKMNSDKKRRLLPIIASCRHFRAKKKSNYCVRLFAKYRLR